eukprot:13915900-Ditylum_brightwellii.AAC.1
MPKIQTVETCHDDLLRRYCQKHLTINLLRVNEEGDETSYDGFDRGGDGHYGNEHDIDGNKHGGDRHDVDGNEHGGDGHGGDGHGSDGSHSMPCPLRP